MTKCFTDHWKDLGFCFERGIIGGLGVREWHGLAHSAEGSPKMTEEGLVLKEKDKLGSDCNHLPGDDGGSDQGDSHGGGKDGQIQDISDVALTGFPDR